MPRYFYNIHGLAYPPDEEGNVLDGPSQARAMAVTHAGEMLKDIEAKFWGAPTWRMDVTDEQGARVCTLRIQGWGDTEDPDAWLGERTTPE